MINMINNFLSRQNMFSNELTVVNGLDLHDCSIKHIVGEKISVIARPSNTAYTTFFATSDQSIAHFSKLKGGTNFHLIPLKAK